MEIEDYLLVNIRNVFTSQGWLETWHPSTLVRVGYFGNAKNERSSNE